MLEMAGYEVIAARDGHEALRFAYAITPDLIIVDMRLPGLDGFEVIEKLRVHPATAAAPIIATSAWAGDEYRQRALALGANVLLRTPVDVANLLQTIEQYLAAE
jgi:CheY-like chemotaxis protein